MQDKAALIVRRFPYEEPYLLHLEFAASNGDFCGVTDIYCDAQELGSMGLALKQFPTKIDDEYLFEYGSKNPKDNCYRYFAMRAYTIDTVGHSAIQFEIHNNQSEPSEGICKFSLRADVASINRLGDEFARFSQLKDLEFVWSPRLVD